MNPTATTAAEPAQGGSLSEAAAAGTPPPADPTRAAVDAVLAWWQLEYPAHNHGALNVPTFSTAGAVVAELLLTRPLADLQRLAVLLWTDRDDPWIFSSDRSVFVLRHRADYLDRRARDTRQPATWGERNKCGHEPPCRDYTECTQRHRAADLKAPSES